ncbi:MAG TPA: phosphotransferase family protein [Acidimicrobiales bacterium]|jgi:aminoglycoside phosphotransferase (APT) family kinase protein|nr:phosphotransferase family protein [Acidimicrobiales bacterium]
MATGARRDDAALTHGLGRWVAEHAGAVPGAAASSRPVTIAGLTHAEGGMANETVLVDFGPGHAGMVVRMPPLEPTFPDYELDPQAAVQNAVAARGVPAPAPAIVERDPSWVGAPFLAMPRVHGAVAGPAPAFDPYVRDAGPALQRVMHDGLVDVLAAVHAVPWQGTGLAEMLSGPGLADAVGRWAAYVEWSSAGDPLPALAQSLDWCARHCPPQREPVLLWGDVRLGNLVFDDARRVLAVLDWDLAALGPREMDLGWHFGLDFMMEELFGQRVAGFPSRIEALERYENAAGYEVRDLAWHEVFALTRALAINDRHQRITGDRRRRENPMGAVLLARLEDASSSNR